MGCLEVAAEMGIMPSEFWGLTYAELVAFRRGHQRGQRHFAGTLAHFTAAIMNSIPAFKKRRPVSGPELMGEGRKGSQHAREHR